jgi:uncharacterized RDD family membrane protein YckC
VTADVRFETPENVQLTYVPAGFGTRFLAAFIDHLLLALLLVVLLFVLLVAGTASEAVARRLAEPFENPGRPGPSGFPDLSLVFVGLWLLFYGLGSFLYFGLSELFLRGQTVGKRSCSIRVAKADGFTLDATSVLVRNVFRVLDHFPPLWIVPVVSARTQRFGDMVAGTIVIVDRPEPVGAVRDQLAGRSAAESRFRFDAAALKRLRPGDVQAVEQILERWPRLPGAQRVHLLDRIVPPLAARLEVDEPERALRIAFLEDLLAAEYRRQNRNLG